MSHVYKYITCAWINTHTRLCVLLTVTDRGWMMVSNVTPLEQGCTHNKTALTRCRAMPQRTSKVCPCDFQCGANPWNHCSSSLPTASSYYSLHISWDTFTCTSHPASKSAGAACLSLGKTTRVPRGNVTCTIECKFYLQPSQTQCAEICLAIFCLMWWQRKKNVDCIVWFYG